VQPPKIQSSGFDDYLPSTPPEYLFEIDYDAETVDEDNEYLQNLPELELRCKDCI
jgi:hypothetical protein